MSDRLEPTRMLALKVWWAFLWRSLLAVVAAGIGIGMLLGVVSAALGIPASSLEAILPLVGILLSVGVSIEVMYRVLKKRFTDFEIALLPRRE